MGEFLFGLGAGMVAFIFMICYGAAKFKGGSDTGLAFVAGLGVSIITWGALILWNS